MMTINNATQVGEMERSVPPNAKQYSPPNPKPKEPAPALPEAKVEAANPEQLKEVLAQSDISLNFRRDDKTGRVIVELIDNSTGDAVKQIPSEVSLRLSEMFSKVQGQLFEARF
jgi:flagellar protein FlaG